MNKRLNQLLGEIASFANINDRDGCDISLEMYRVNLGPITQEVWERVVGKFNGMQLACQVWCTGVE